ncbi:MAG: PilZ domain-containing protein [Caulobacteraceae bacterium]|nr:PilZ domain-containing protein [Caulobacteraceae bacterium]
MSHHDPVNDNVSPPLRERRSEPRTRVLFKGKIVYSHNSFSADCVIRDLSVGGARIVIGPEAVCDDPYLVVIRNAVAHRSRAVWRTGQQLGMRFLTSIDLSRETPLQLRAIQRLWLELAPR